MRVFSWHLTIARGVEGRGRVSDPGKTDEPIPDDAQIIRRQPVSRTRMLILWRSPTKAADRTSGG